LIGSAFGAIMFQVGFFLPISLWIQRARPEEQAMAAGRSRRYLNRELCLPDGLG